MDSLQDLILHFTSLERQAGNILEETAILALAVSAVSFHAGFAQLDEQIATQESIVIVDENVMLTHSEWSLIKPLFILYIERETALQLEASRGMGIDVFGRSSSEIASDITQYEESYANKAFYQDIISV